MIIVALGITFGYVVLKPHIQSKKFNQVGTALTFGSTAIAFIQLYITTI